MITVSLSVYNDADLAEQALASIRTVLPNARIQVVDGKYSTFKPDAPPNSTDNIQDVANAYGAEYHPAGPFDRERDKHIARVELAPDDDAVLFLDADERLLAADMAQLDPDVGYQPRIFNALVYGPHAVYWPRYFPAGEDHRIETINRWDAYLLNVPVRRTDDITILHRHDLRDREYREAKYERFGRENRRGRYEDNFKTYLNDEWDADFFACPECGEQSVTQSQLTRFGDEFSYVECCVARDGCYAAVKPLELDEWRYLPDEWARGWEEDPKRLRWELIDAGCTFVQTASVERMVRDMRPAVKLWVEETLGDRDTQVFA